MVSRREPGETGAGCNNSMLAQEAALTHSSSETQEVLSGTEEKRGGSSLTDQTGSHDIEF